MPKIATIKASEAPPPPRKMSKGAAELLDAISALKKDEVLKLEPDEPKLNKHGQPTNPIRGLKTGVGRIASNAGIKTESWDDGEFVYVKRAE